MQLFSKVLKKSNIVLKNYDPEKTRHPVTTLEGGLSLPKTQEKFRQYVLANQSRYAKLLPICYDLVAFEKMLKRYSKKKGLFGRQARFKSTGDLPEQYQGLTFNMDQTQNTENIKFFLTTKDETMAPVGAKSYMRARGMTEDDAIAMSRIVTPMYMPREEKGVTVKLDPISKLNISYFNTYTPPLWKGVRLKNKAELPLLFEKLVNHLFPLEIERRYFYCWLYKSLFERAFIYLVLCGDPGVGKNRLKLVVRALHGFSNVADGKKSSLTDRFNSQFTDTTLVWFDELKYTMNEENALKELQNDTISIEKKGIDATKSTRLYSSFVISNNKPRDNFLDFDARKFAPLVLTNKRLQESMSSKQIDRLTNKVEKEDSPEFDPVFLTRIVTWLKQNVDPDEFPNLEYKGPMFWKLCHTSMSRWQKVAAATIMETPEDTTGRMQFVEGKGFLWSTVEEAVFKKGKLRDFATDYTTVMHFFKIFRDREGHHVFEVKPDSKNKLLGDFYVRVVKKDAKVLDDPDVLKEFQRAYKEDEKETKSKKRNSEERKAKRLKRKLRLKKKRREERRREREKSRERGEA